MTIGATRRKNARTSAYRDVILSNCRQLQRLNKALDTPRSTILDHCLTNGPFGEKSKDLLRIADLPNIDEEYIGMTKDIYNVLIDVVNLDDELDALIKTNDTR